MSDDLVQATADRAANAVRSPDVGPYQHKPIRSGHTWICEKCGVDEDLFPYGICMPKSQGDRTDAPSVEASGEPATAVRDKVMGDASLLPWNSTPRFTGCTSEAKDEAYQTAQAIIIRHVDCDVSDVQAVQLIAEAILASRDTAFRDGAKAERAASIERLIGLLPLDGDPIHAAARGALEQGVDLIGMSPLPSPPCVPDRSQK